MFELVTDGRGVVAGAAPEAAQLLAIDERFLIGKPLASFVAERDRHRFRNLLLDLSETGGTVEASLALTPRGRGAISSDIVGSHEDGRIVWRVTTDEQAEAGHSAVPLASPPDRWSERLLTRLPQGIVVVDTRLTIVFVNPAARRLLGPVRVGDPLPDRSPTLSLREHAKTLFGRSPALGRRVLEVGERAISVEALTSADRQTGVLILEDVSVEELRRRVEREFVENASHELRTPVSAIVSVVEALESGAKEEPAIRDQFLRHIGTQAERLSRLATSLLLLARMQEGMAQPHLDLIPAKPLLDEVAENIEPQPGVTVRAKAPPELAMLADRDLLRQALDNIAANAVRHTLEGEIALEGRDLGAITQLEIADTGVGMSADAVERAFVRFHRSSSTGGAGLGLAIAHEAVQAQSGTIHIDSAPGAGTRVRIGLPSARLVR